MRAYQWLITAIFLSLAVPSTLAAQATLVRDTVSYDLAQVVRVARSSESILPGTDTPTKQQALEVKILSGEEKGRIVSFENDFAQLSIGDKFYLVHTENALDGTNFYAVGDFYRLPILIALVTIFFALLLFFGGKQGVRGAASLAGSIVLIFYVLVPGILLGWNAILVAIGVSSLIIVAGSYITHGFNRATSSAVLGMLITVLMTGLGAYIAMHMAHLSGYTSEENVYLNFDTRGTLDMVGILFGGIMIGLLGVLYDIAIGQAVAVDELYGTANIERAEAYRRAMRIGREHIGALVNTLAIAYVGASLPLLLLIVNSSTEGLAFTLNNELFATEIIRILIGSVGLVLAVPITTWIAVRLMQGGKHTGISHAHQH